MRYADYRDGRAAKPVPIGDNIEGIIDIDFDWIEWTPSTDISQAMMVVDRMIELGHGVHIHWHRQRKFWDVIFSIENRSWKYGNELLQLAILEAALKAVE